MAVYSPISALSGQDISSPLHSFDLPQGNHQDFLSKPGEDILHDAALDSFNPIFGYNMVVDSITGMLFWLQFVANYFHPAIEDFHSEQENPLFYTDQAERHTHNFFSKPAAATGTHHAEEGLQISALNMDSTGWYLYLYFSQSMELDVALLIRQII